MIAGGFSSRANELPPCEGVVRRIEILLPVYWGAEYRDEGGHKCAPTPEQRSQAKSSYTDGKGCAVSSIVNSNSSNGAWNYIMTFFMRR